MPLRAASTCLETPEFRYALACVLQAARASSQLQTLGLLACVSRLTLIKYSIFLKSLKSHARRALALFNQE